MSWLKRNWFTLALFAVVLVGYEVPQAGRWLRAEVILEPIIALMLFLMSLTLSVGGLARGFVSWRGLLPAVVGSVILLPLLAAGAQVLPWRQDLLVGIAITAAVPTTLASATILTRVAGGNAAISLAATMILNGVTFLVTPVILLLIVGRGGAIPGSEMLEMGIKLGIIVLLPVSLGQVARLKLADWAGRHRGGISVFSQLLILTVVFTAVTRAAREAEGQAGLQASDLIGLLLLVAVMHLLVAGVCWWGAGLLHAPRTQRIPAMFSGAQKTLPLGLYIAAAYFSELRFAALPMIFFHASQLVIDAVIAGRLAQHKETAQ